MGPTTRIHGPQRGRRSLRRLGTAWAIGLLLVTLTAATSGEVAITVHDDAVLRELPPSAQGTNFVALWNDTGASPGTVACFAQTGFGLLRFPGGVACEWYDWQTALTDGSISTSDAWRLASSTGGSLLLQTNAFNADATNHLDNGGPHQAAWARWARDQGIRVAWWEVGNEPEFDAPQSLQNQGADAVMAFYDARFDEQARAIKAVDASAKVMGPGTTDLGNLERFLAAHGDRQGTGLVDAISFHWYAKGGFGNWPTHRDDPQNAWPSVMASIRALIARYDTRDLPVYLTEWNWGGGTNWSQYCMITGLMNADCVGAFRASGLSGDTHYCLQAIRDNWGMLGSANPYDLKPQNAPNHTYFALVLAARLGPHVLAVDDGADAASTLSAYAAVTDDGTIQLMAINKSETAQPIAVSFARHQPQGRAVSVWSLVGKTGSLWDNDVIYNGVLEPRPATDPLPPPQADISDPVYRRTVPAASMVLLEFAPDGSQQLTSSPA